MEQLLRDQVVQTINELFRQIPKHGMPNTVTLTFNFEKIVISHSINVFEHDDEEHDDEEQADDDA